MPRFRLIVVAAVGFSVLGCALWGLVIAGFWARPLPPRIQPAAIAASATTTVIAAMCWLNWWRARRDEDRSLLIRTLVGVVPSRREARTARLRRVL